MTCTYSTGIVIYIMLKIWKLRLLDVKSKTMSFLLFFCTSFQPLTSYGKMTEILYGLAANVCLEILIKGACKRFFASRWAVCIKFVHVTLYIFSYSILFNSPILTSILWFFYSYAILSGITQLIGVSWLSLVTSLNWGDSSAWYMI